MKYSIQCFVSFTIHIYYTIDNEALLRFIMIALHLNEMISLRDNRIKKYMANWICISSCTFLNFACATMIGDNVDTEKSAILVLNS